MTFRTIAAVAAITALAGCSHYALPKYTADAQTVSTLRKLQPAKVTVGTVTGESAGLSGITCRGVGPMQPPDGLTFGEYLRGAIKSELLFADLYDEKSPIALNAVLSNLDFSSGMTDAEWRMNLELRSPTGAVSSVTNYRFKGSFVGEVACNQTAQAGMGAFQLALLNAVSDPKFAQLVRASAVQASPVASGSALSTAVSDGPVLAASRPSPSVQPAQPSGRDGYVAGAYAREQRCAAYDTPAVLVARGPGFETYSVACTSGDTMVVRCEMGNCRAMQ